METKTYYWVCGVVGSVGVTSSGHKSRLSLAWEDGMVGVMPVFDNEILAQRSARGRFDVVAVGGVVIREGEGSDG